MRKLNEIVGKEKAGLVLDNDSKMDILLLRGGRPVPGINDKDMGVIIEALKHNTNIKKLVLAENEITDEGLFEIGELKFITYLDLPNNDLGDGCLQNLSKMERLEYLDLGGSNHLSGKNLEILFDNMKFLKDLYLNEIDDRLINKQKIPMFLNLHVNGELIKNEENEFKVADSINEIEKWKSFEANLYERITKTIVEYDYIQKKLDYEKKMVLMRKLACLFEIEEDCMACFKTKN